MIKIKKNDLLDNIILLFMLLDVLILRWLGIAYWCSFILLALIVLRMGMRIQYFYNKMYFWVAIVIALYPILSCFLQGGGINIALSNTFPVTVSLCVLMYISFLLLEKRCFLSNFLQKACFPLNIYMIINIPIIYLQSQGYYWLSGISNISTNTMKEDMMSGLLGFNGTPFLAMFIVFLIILNWFRFNQLRPSIKKTLFGWYIVALVIYSLILPLFNENTGFYFAFISAAILFLIYRYFPKGNISNKKFTYYIIRRIIPICIVVLIILFILFQFTPIGDIVSNAFNTMISGLNLTSNARGSGERIGMIAYALGSSKLRWFGYGLAKMKWTQQGGFGFLHFGQSDCGVFLILGGIFYLALIILFLFLIFKKSCYSTFISILTVVFFLIVAIFTQLFTQATLIISTSFIWAVMILYVDGPQLANNKGFYQLESQDNGTENLTTIVNAGRSRNIEQKNSVTLPPQ